jgi:hypothetical protein
MRDNGLPDFEDPDTSDGGLRIGLPAGTDKQKVDAAQLACQKYLPNGGKPPKADPADLEKQRQFSQCMRDNGIGEFPDPSAEGGINIEMRPGSAMDPANPRFKEAEKACAKYQPASPGEPRTESTR